MELDRGDIVLVNFNPIKGKEMGKIRIKEKLATLEKREIKTIQHCVCKIVGE